MTRPFRFATSPGNAHFASRKDWTALGRLLAIYRDLTPSWMRPASTLGEPRHRLDEPAGCVSNFLACAAIRLTSSAAK